MPFLALLRNDRPETYADEMRNGRESCRDARLITSENRIAESQWSRYEP